MKHPKIILRPVFYPISSDPVPFEEYKYHGIVGKDSYEYIYWFQLDGKWKCYKLYFEKGNRIYEDYQRFLINGNDESGWSCKFVDFK